MSGEDDGWRFHVGAPTRAQRRRLLVFMTRRSLWALFRHGWRGAAGRAAAVGFAVFALAAVLSVRVRGSVVLTVSVWLLLPACVVVAFVLASEALGTAIRWWRLWVPGSRWVAHWCEGPDGQLAVRMTKPGRPKAGQPAQWPGTDLFGQGGSGRRLLAFLQRLADDERATLVIKTGPAPLVAYYQRAGFTVVKRSWFGTTVLGANSRSHGHPAPVDPLPHGQGPSAGGPNPNRRCEPRRMKEPTDEHRRCE